MTLPGVDFSGSTLTGVDFTAASLLGANFTEAVLDLASLGRAMLCQATLTRAKLRRVDARGADLSGADLHHCNCFGANFAMADLSNARLVGAHFQQARLTGAKLPGAFLNGASLTQADLTEVDLKDARLDDADLRQANFRSAVVHGARFYGASCDATMWAGIDLSGATGLERLVHFGPSTVGIDTVMMSAGRLPDVFLRACGVAEHIIDLQKSLVAGAEPIQFYSCFVSYSSHDDEFARRLHGRLQQEGLRVWFAPEDMKGGSKLHEQIDDAIRRHDKLLLVLSEASMASEWVKDEISKARKRERREGCRVLFPIRLCRYEVLQEWQCYDATGNLADEVAQYFVPDFSEWKEHDRFESAFARLLKDLRASAE
jgi:hypothetical protein